MSLLAETKNRVMPATNFFHKYLTIFYCIYEPLKVEQLKLGVFWQNSWELFRPVGLF